MKFYDEEGNEYTQEQVRAAAEEKAKDETGQGSFGGLNEDQDGKHTPTGMDLAVPIPSGSRAGMDLAKPIPGARPTGDPLDAAEPAGAPKTSGFVAGDDIKAKDVVEKPSGGRELNPMHPGKFISDNLFGGFNGKYITGKRPMTLFDYVTDAAAAYSGEDIGARNSKIINADAQRTRASTEAIKNQRETEKFELEKQKTGLEVDKMAGEAIGRMMQDYDSDLWPQHLKELQKEHGINIPGPTISMVTRMTEMLNKEGASHPAEVLENQEKYSPELYNRVRHTMALLNKNVQESQAKDLEKQKGEQALGMRAGPEKRAETTAAREESGVEGAKALLAEDLASDDPAVRNKAKARLSALNLGGTSRAKVIDELTGNKASGGRQSEFQSYVHAAREELGEGAQESAVIARAQEMAAQGKARSEMVVRGARNLADKEAAVAQGISSLDNMAVEVQKLNPGDSGFSGRLYTWARQKWGRTVADPQTAVIDSLAADMTNVSRTLGGEKGPLTEGDIARVAIALRFGDTDTWESWNARYQKARRVALAGLEAIRDAQKKNLDTPIKLRLDDQLNIVGSASGNAGESQSGESKTSEGTTDRKAKAEQWASRINAEKDPAKREMLKRQAVSELNA